MKSIKNIEKEIVKRLLSLNPYKIILFGSYARKNTSKFSDIDLYVVTNDDFLPQSFDEKMKIKIKYVSAIYDIMKEFPIDIIVHTKKMYENFLKSENPFAKEIFEHGKVLYESKYI
ncbi:MAG: nucleotidyltransferase domain-containing protein [Brevinematales bacterium]|nr:nucleotidyltransferase domain-containing protein [Brevinematales bacterium]